MAEILDFFDEAAASHVNELNKYLERNGVKPSPEFSDAWRVYLAKDMRRMASKNRERKRKVDDRDNSRRLLTD